MSTYDDYDQPPRERHRRDQRPPYPQAEGDYGSSERRQRPTRSDAPAASAEGSQVGKSDIPPPPLGSAMKREGSRSRVPNLKPDFPDEASYLNGRSPDLERKTGDRDRRFRERREGYTSDEGEALRSDPRRQRSQREPGGRARPSYDEDDRRRTTTNASDAGSSVPVRDRRRPPRSDGEDFEDGRRSGRNDDRYRAPPRDYEDRPRRRRDPDPYEDESTLPSRRRGPRDGVEYGAEPIRSSRREDDRRRPERPRRSRYDDEEEGDAAKARRRKSLPPQRRDDRYDDDDDYYDKERDSRRRRDDRDDREQRRPARRRSYDDDDDYYRRRDDRRSDRDRRDDKRKEPTSFKVGKVDVGPAFDKLQKNYATLAPMLTPIVMNYLKNKK